MKYDPSTSSYWPPILLVILLTVLGCASDRGEKGKVEVKDPVSSPPPRPGAVAITGYEWRLAELNGKPALPTSGDGAAARPSLRLDPKEKRASGSTGVNQFSGTYELSGEALQFGPMMSTRRAGPPDMMQQETAFTEALTRTAKARLTGGGSLELLDAGGGVLARFEPVSTAP